jgi:hypothetical protein
MSAIRMAVLVTSLLVAFAAAVASGAAATPTAPPVTVIGDSVLTAVEWNEKPLGVFEQGLDLHLDIGVCRTLEGASCPFEGGRVPTLLDVVEANGLRLGPTVLVEVGYNDPAAEFAQRVEDSINALLAAGVQKIIWVDMRAWQQQYVGMNQTLQAAAARHPQLTVLDWEAYSHDHYSWFQGDGVHLVYDGAMAMAAFLNAGIKQALAPPAPLAQPPTVSAARAPLQIVRRTLPVAWVGKHYATRLTAAGGRPPYRWRLTSGPLPRGLHLLANGQLTGTPRRPGKLVLTLQAADGDGRQAIRYETLVIRNPTR